ncbi:MAG: hypothetical protein ACU0BB_00420 [Paracoccaceae bacterium]
MRNLRIPCALTAITLVTAGPVFANSPICSNDPNSEQVSGVTLQGQNPDCQKVVLSDGDALVCQWSFAYRSSHVEAAIKALVGEIENCSQAKVSGVPAGVNHPDTHTVYQYGTERMQITASLKDKAALGQSFVFLKIQDLPQN